MSVVSGYLGGAAAALTGVIKVGVIMLIMANSEQCQSNNSNSYYDKKGWNF